MNRIPNITTKITGSINYFSLISPSICGFKSPIKRQRLTDWLPKPKTMFFCIQNTDLKNKDRYFLRVKGWNTIFQANSPKKRAGVAILILNKTDFQPKVIK
jgi:exonuclease III